MDVSYTTPDLKVSEGCLQILNDEIGDREGEEQKSVFL